MRQGPLRRSVLAAAITIAVVASSLGSATAHHPIGWHWRRGSNPVTVRLLDSVTAAWQQPVERAAREWSRRSGPVDIAIEKSMTKASKRRKCPAPDGAVRICNADYGDTSWAAITRVVRLGKHIVRAKIIMNDRGATAHRALACHEIGHALGLAHRQQEATSCLTPIVAPAQMHPDAHDIQQLRRIYDHSDGSAAQDTGASDAQDTAGAHDHDIRVTKKGPYTILHFRTPRVPPSPR